jgi:hypothetical protein
VLRGKFIASNVSIRKEENWGCSSVVDDVPHVQGPMFNLQHQKQEQQQKIKTGLEVWLK